MKRVLEQRLRQALELHETGMALQRQNLRRRHPDWDEERLEQAMRHWIRQRPAPGWDLEEPWR